MTELHELTGLAQAAAIRAGDVSPSRWSSTTWTGPRGWDRGRGRLHRPHPRARAGAGPGRGAAVAHARADGDRLPPLLGVPVPIKDLNRVAGVAPTFGAASGPNCRPWMTTS